MNKNTTHEDKSHHLPAMAYKTIIECKHSYAINPSQTPCCKPNMKQT